MDTVTVTLDRVFDLHRIPAARYNKKHTRFGFEASGLKKYFVRAPGWPRLEPGDKLVVLLRNAQDWQSLLGWLNTSNGEVVHEDPADSIVPLLASLALMSVFTFFVFDSVPGYPLWSPLWAIASGLMALLKVRSFLSARRVRKQLRAIRLSHAVASTA